MSQRNGNGPERPAAPRPAAPLYPVIVKDDAYAPSDAPIAYLVTQDGLFIVRDTPLFSVSVRVDGVPGLAPHTPYLHLKIPPLPVALVERAIGFFRAVYERWQGEAILILFYEERSRRYQLAAPPQLIRGRFERGRFRAELQLEYGTCERPGPEFVRLGTFHSHGHAGPTHSQVDEHDELYESGLHITAGYVHSSAPKFAAAFVVGRTRFTVAPADIVPPLRAARRWPAAWMDRVVVACDARDAFGAGADRRHGARSGGSRWEDGHD